MPRQGLGKDIEVMVKFVAHPSVICEMGHESLERSVS
jgi:hypothetical protein